MSTMRILAMVLAAGLLTGAAASSGSSSRASAPRSSERDAARRELYDTTWPVPTADTWRTSSIASGGLPDQVRSGDLRARSVKLGAVPIFGITYDRHSIFVLGGAPHLLDLFTKAQGNDLPDDAAAVLAGAAKAAPTRSATPYVARIDPSTMKAQILDLPKGTTPNYPGSLVAHRNGKLYAVATATLFEIDPKTFAITRSLALPLNPAKPASTIYNTAQISPRNGDLLLKTAPNQGTGLLVAVDVKSMKVRSQLETTLSTARMTTLMQGDTEYGYLPGTTATLRFRVTDAGFTPDPNWSRTYRTESDGTQPGVAMTPTGDHHTVVFPDNNTVLVKVTAPLRIFWQSTVDTNSPVSSVNATSTDKPGGSFAPPPADPFASSIVVAADAVNGRTAAWKITNDGSLKKLWVTSRYKISVGAAIVADQHRLYTDDRVCNTAGKHCKLYLVIADLMTGKEIARVRVAGSQPSIGRIFVGPHAVYYIATQGESPNGYVTKITTTN